MPLTEGFHPGYERKGIYPVELVLGQLGNPWAVFDGELVPLISLRYQVFAQSRSCISCGLFGTFFAKERSAKRVKNRKEGDPFFVATTSSWHLNLYALRADGKEILMTKDHIVPRSKGGLDVLPNLQTMCAPCNCAKQDNQQYQVGLPFGAPMIIE